MRKLGRNEKCICGSGLKYKYCHGDPVKQILVETIAKKAAKEKMAELIKAEKIKRGVENV